MSNGVELKSIAYLLDKIYLIRIYQRGYKWEKDQLDDLLDDFKEFIDVENKHLDEFYCLQPIVVKKLTKEEKDKTKHTLRNSLSEKEIEEEIYEVIDGQQRLTTINLILSYLENEIENIKIDSFPKIIYEIRPESQKYLQKFRQKNALEVLKKESVSSIDFYHMFDIFQCLTAWFNKHPDYKLKILKLLTSFRVNNVRVIWYEVDKSENSIEVFRRFNVGKIPLNDAELIKALLLKNNKGEQAAQKYVISQQWQQFENKLQDSLFWSFLNPRKEYTSRIEFLFDLVYELEMSLYDQKSTVETDKHKVFRFFDKLVKSNADDLLVIWDKVSNVFDELNQFYNHPVHYHYLGFLNNYESKKGFDLFELIKSIHSEETQITDRNSLTKHLLDLVKLRVKKVFFDQNGIKLNYGSSSKDLRNFFLLLNVEVTKKMNNTIENEFAHRYPFSKHQNTDFDIEHIGSQTDRVPKDDGEKIEYLQDFYTDYLEEIPNELKLEIEKLWENSNGDSGILWKVENIKLDVLNNRFNLINENIVEFIDGQERVLEKDSIGNLTLLNADINRSYGNSFFPTKRKLIIEQDLTGAFIPPATKNVFLKYYSVNVNKHTRWTQKDSDGYKMLLTNILSEYQDENI